MVLDGPVLGALSGETKQAIQDVSLRSQDRMQAYLDAQRRAGKEPDPVELAKLRQQTRDDLAHVLSPPELEEFLLRYSQDANDLRTEFGQLRFFDPTPDEFRAVFRATDTLDQRIQLLADAKDPSSLDARKALEDQRENAIKIALGPKRYEEYRMLHDPVYRDAVAAARGGRHAGSRADDLCHQPGGPGRTEPHTRRHEPDRGAEEHRAEAGRAGATPGQHRCGGAGLAAGTAAPAADPPAEKGLCPRPGRQRGHYRA